MTTKTSDSDSSPEISQEGTSDTGPLPLIRDRDERLWRTYLTPTDSVTSTLLHATGEDISQNSLGFLYDYYGVIDEAHNPPSPTSSLSNSETDSVALNSGSNHQEADHDYLSAGSSAKTVKSQLAITSGAASTGNEASAVKVPASVSLKTEPGSCTPVDRTTTVTVVSSGRCTQPVDISQISPESYIISQFPILNKPGNTVFQSEEKYAIILEAPTSIIQKRGEDTLTYLNKGQFYAVTFECSAQQEKKLSRVKTIIYLVFRDEKDPRNELSHWKFWHAQQPNPNQRAFDVDRKSCQNIDEHIEEIAYNALGFTWNPEHKAKIVIRINCLSTDFSPQKGVKGIPLHIQTDTYEELDHTDVEPVHRAFCQIKVFRDKGAERKNKDETKSAEKIMMKFMRQSSASPPGTSVTSVFQVPNKVTRLLPTTPYGAKPVTFSLKNANNHQEDPPTMVPPPLLTQLKDREQKRGFSAALAVAKDDLEDLSVFPKYKNPRVVKKRVPAVTIYVKKEEEKIYNALLLENLTTDDLKRAVATKYGMPAEMIKNVYKRTRKGLLVNLDNEMVELFVDEDDFVMTVNFDNQLGYFELIFQY